MRIRMIFILTLLSICAFSQPSFAEYSKTEFYLDTILLKQIKNKEIKFYYSNKFYSNLKKNKKNNLFYFSSDLGKLYITTKIDTILIKTPVLLKDGFDRSQKLKIISIKDIIKLETGCYNFDTELIKSFLYNNQSCNLTENGNCEIFYFDLPKKEKLIVNKEDFKYLKEIEIQEDE